MTLRGGGGGGPALSVTMTLIFPKIVWTCPLSNGANTGGAPVRYIYRVFDKINGTRACINYYLLKKTPSFLYLEEGKLKC